MQSPHLGVGQVEFLHGTRQAHIAQSALLLEAAGFLQRHLVGEQPLFHAGHEHYRELQPLGRVQRHHLHAVLELVGFVIAGIERGFRQKGLQRHAPFANLGVFQRLALGKRLGSGNQLFKVLDPGLALFAFFVAMMFEQSAALVHVIDDLVERQRRGLVIEVLDQIAEGLDRVARTPLEGAVMQGVVQCLPQRAFIQPRPLTQDLDRAGADTPRRHVDDPLQRRIVIAIEQQAQIGQGVLDFQTLVEAVPAIDAIGHALTDQRLLDDSRLGVGAVEDGHFAAAKPFVDLVANGIDDEARLVEIIEAAIHRDRLAAATVGPQLLAHALGVVADQGVG